MSAVKTLGLGLMVAVPVLAVIGGVGRLFGPWPIIILSGLGSVGFIAMGVGDRIKERL